MLDEFNKLGFHTIHNFFDVNLINKIIKETNPLFEHTESDSNILQVHEKAPSVKEIIFDERLNELVTKILGKNEPVQTQWRFKPPEGNGFPYHQDDFWTRAGHGNTINVLVHFEKTNELNGCIKVLPESHNPPFHSDGVSLNCDKGDITILHNHLIHWSDKNTSLDWRRNLLVMYVKNNIDYIRGENAKRKTIQKT